MYCSDVLLMEVTGFSHYPHTPSSPLHCPRLRDVQLVEVLESAYGMMRNALLSAVHCLMGSAPSWQQYEVALYGLRAVSVMAKGRFLNRMSGAAGGRDVTPEVQREAAEALQVRWEVQVKA